MIPGLWGVTAVSRTAFGPQFRTAALG
uniref:Uncharacterized protein n=1 Tax=Anguilla anguilla TaxID=7936 RepID=A0A0E9XY11_ANGAN